MASTINFRTIAATTRLTQWNKGVLDIRKAVQDLRAKNLKIIPEVFAPVTIILPDGLNFQFVTPGNLNPPAQTTSATLCDLTYNLNINTIYPFQMKIRQNNAYRDIMFSDTYSKVWAVSHFTGIMIAEQIRFSTLQDSLRKTEYAIYNQQRKQWQQYFNFFYDNFKGQGGGLYNNWGNLTSQSTSVMLQNGKRVDVTVPVMLRR